MSHLTDSNNWAVAVTTLFIVVLCIVLHFEVLSNSMSVLRLIHVHRRLRTLVLILIILGAHVAEIWLFAFGYYFLSGIEGMGRFTGVVLVGLPDYAYYSATVYTTLGFGDVTPVGAIRFMTGMEALMGLVMITWSASFTFLEMQRDWTYSWRSPRGDLRPWDQEAELIRLCNGDKALVERLIRQEMARNPDLSRAGAALSAAARLHGDHRTR
jgi:hypothetical protein